MVIWFNNKIAREQLINYGVVYTFRSRRNTIGYQNAFYRDGKEQIKIGQVLIERVKKWFDLEGYLPIEYLLTNYLYSSGFNTIEDWIKVIRGFRTNRTIPEYGEIYRVTLSDKDFKRLKRSNNALL